MLESSRRKVKEKRVTFFAPFWDPKVSFFALFWDLRKLVSQGPWYGAVGVNPRHGGDGQCLVMEWTRRHSVAPTGLGKVDGLSAVGLRPRLYALAPLGQGAEIHPALKRLLSG